MKLKTTFTGALSGCFLMSMLLFSSCSDDSSPVDAGNGLVQYSGKPTRISGSPYPLAVKPDTLFVVDLGYLTNDEILAVESLQGVLAQTKPRIYVTDGPYDSYTTWLKDLQDHYGVIVNSTYSSNVAGLLSHFKKDISGYVLGDLSEKYLHSAISLAGIKKAAVATANTEQMFKDAGIPMVEDATSMTMLQFMTQHQSEMSKTAMVYQAAEKNRFLTDYAIYGKMFHHYEGTEVTLQQVASTLTANGALFGWGESEDGLVATAGRSSVYVHAADYAKNLSVLSNFGVETKQKRHVTDVETIKNVHTVCFLVTDGDNIQWSLGPFYEGAAYYGNSGRGKVSIGWTMTPSMAELAPTVLKKIYDKAGVEDGKRDYFVAGPSGIGYMNPDIYPQLSSYVSLNTEYMKQADMRILNIIGNSMNMQYIKPFLEQDQIDAVFYYYYSSYIGGLGTINWVNEKPVIAGRYQLWTGLFDNPASLAIAINNSSTDVSSSRGYSLIPVHIWSDGVDQILETVSHLNPNIRIVAPDEFVALIKKNVIH